MLAVPDHEIPAPLVRSGGLSAVHYAIVATLLATIGLSAIWPTVLALWHLWTADALKSIGMAIPLVSLVLVLRVWRTLGWQAEGTWWGLPLLLIAMAVVRIQQRAVLILVVSPNWSSALPPPSLVLLMYASGVVLLLGGVKLYRAALFPIVLLWFANPVPHVFSLWVDLPLQQASAHLARAFAMGLGHPLTQDNLRLMFTPEFGMFIAPGCNGIRGSVTMGLIALIAGYVYRFRWYVNALFVAGAILLGYLFNFVRLCLLVLYYGVALHFPSLQDKAENADYVIGAALFLCATLLLFAVVHRVRDGDSSNLLRAGTPPAPARPHDSMLRIQYGKVWTVAAAALFGLVVMARAHAAVRLSGETNTGAEERFPQHLGAYRRVRSWSETLDTGPIVYYWAQYAPADGGTPIAVGVSPTLNGHDPLICHAIRGEHPVWQGPLSVATGGVTAIDFSSAFYKDGTSEYLEASTQCSGATCGEFATERTHFGFIYSRPDGKSFLSTDPGRSIPILVRADAGAAQSAADSDVERQRLTADLLRFLGVVRLEDLARSVEAPGN